MNYRHLIAIASLIVGFVVYSAYGQVQPCEKQKLTASDADFLDLFGNSVSISGDAAVIGAWNDDGPFAFAWGSAYLFRLIDGVWIEEQKITPQDANEQDRFGHIVAISGDIAVVSAHLNDDACNGPDTINCDSGSAYIFGFSNGSWSQKQKLIAFDDQAGDLFGLSLAVSGDVVVVGAPREDEACGGSPSCDAGAVYVYRGNGNHWFLEQKLMASDADSTDNFGKSVSISDDLILVGASGDNGVISNSGSAYVFRYNPDTSQWVEEQKVTASDEDFSDIFGWSVSISSQGVALIGAPFNDDACPEDIACNSGSAYLFRYNGSTWIEEQKFVIPDAAALDLTAWHVSIDSINGDVAVIGSRGNDGTCPPEFECDSGAAYLYRFDGSEWILQAMLTPHDPEPSDFYGSAVAVSGTSVLIGSEGDDDDGTGSGSVYFYTMEGPDGDGDNVLDDCDNCPGAFNPKQEDSDEDGIGDACDGPPEDLDGDGVVSTSDLLILFANWGPCAVCKMPGDCPADFDADCTVSTSDLLILFANWG